MAQLTIWSNKCRALTHLSVGIIANHRNPGHTSPLHENPEIKNPGRTWRAPEVFASMKSVTRLGGLPCFVDPGSFAPQKQLGNCQLDINWERDIPRYSKWVRKLKGENNGKPQNPMVHDVPRHFDRASSSIFGPNPGCAGGVDTK